MYTYLILCSYSNYLGFLTVIFLVSNFHYIALNASSYRHVLNQLFSFSHYVLHHFLFYCIPLELPMMLMQKWLESEAWLCVEMLFLKSFSSNFTLICPIVIVCCFCQLLMHSSADNLPDDTYFDCDCNHTRWR